MPATIDEIAKRCGKSRTTVSHILRNGPNAQRYSEDTQQKVRKAAEELNFVPNFFASQIRKQYRRVLMIAFGELNDPYAAAIADAFEDAAAERGYYVFVTTLHRERDHQLYQAALGETGIQALAVVGYSSRRRLPDSELKSLADRGTHIVSIGRPVDSSIISQVDYDNLGGMEKGIDYVAEQGARRIWILWGDEKAPAPTDAGGLRSRHGLAYSRQLGLDAQLIRPEGRHTDDQTEGLARLLAHESPPDAVIGCTDTAAMQVIQALTSHGLVVGRDVAVIGYNDEPHAALVTPSLTTVRIPMTNLGRVGANVLIDQYEGRESPGNRLVFQTDIVVRKSGFFAPN